MKLDVPGLLLASMVGLGLLANVSFSQQEQWGRLAGTVTYDGVIPPKGVAALVVYLKTPVGQSFPIHANDKVRKKVVTIDDTFSPHIVAHFPSFTVGGRQVPTGERFALRNNSPIGHNFRSHGRPLKNPGFNFNLPPNTGKEVALVPQDLPILVQCDIHPGENAKVFVFDHPYFANTKGDGSFIIPRVPVGAKITLMAWHEDVGYVFGKDGKTIAIQPGANKLDFTVQAK